MTCRRALFLLALPLAACATTPKPAADADGPQPGAAQRPAEDVSSSADVPKMGEPGPNEEVVKFDVNNDTQPDVFKFYQKGSVPKDAAQAAKADPKGDVKDGAGGEAGALLRKEVDLNRDGKLDLWTWYGRDGSVERQAYDLDFDGKVDENVFYEKGVVVRKELFHGFSERPDTFKYYEKAKLVRVERDTNDDGRPDTWEYWEGDQIDRIGVDKNNDGNVDVWFKPKAKQ